jgi:ABC-type sulfate transport system substrate-binding protein
MPRHLRLAAAILCCVGVAGCAASREEVAARLGAEYVGKNVDTLVAKFGPPTSMFKTYSGQTSYQWQFSNQTNIAVNQGFGCASTQYCKVSVIASPTGVVSQLDTEDSNAGIGISQAVGVYGSMCANRLGMRPQA